MKYFLSEKSAEGLKKLLNNSILDLTPSPRRRRSVDGGGTSSDYAGPFAVSLIIDEETEKKEFQIGSEAVASYIVAGLTKIDVDVETLPASGDGIWLNITCDNGIYDYEFLTSEPEITDINYVVQLCQYDSATDEIVQIQYGQVYIAGRIV